MSPDAKRQNLPLAGITVADFSAVMAGPYCTRMLGDMGADVIKVESSTGDHIRQVLPLRDGHSTYFGHLNAGKRSVVMDLKHPRGLEAARALCDKADVLVENFRPGVMKRLGLHYATLSERNPALVYCSISGFGQEGPDAGRPAYAQIVHATSGLDMVNAGYQDGLDRPPNSGVFHADVMAAMYAVMAIQSALLGRVQTGRGQHLDVTLLESIISLMPYEYQYAQFPETEKKSIYKPTRAKDGYIMVVYVTYANFLALCDAVGRPELKDDPRFATSGDRTRNRDAFMAEVEKWTLERTADECEEQLSAAGVACTRYRTPADNLTNPTLLARESFTEVHDPAGSYLVPNLPFRTGSDRPRVGAAVPELGAATDEVLREVVGFSDEEIVGLREAGAVGVKAG